MSDDERARLSAAYRDGLARWLDGDGEAALARAYEVGREALVQGLGVLELTVMHDTAAASLRLSSTARSDDERVAAYFAEAVAPFEMALRGYQESNQNLAAVNLVLSRQNEDLMEAQRAAAAANRELEAFAGRAAHDLRSPLNVVDGFAQLLLDDEAYVGDRERGFVAEIRGAVTQMLSLCHELLQLSKAGGAELSRERVDVSALAGAVVARLQNAWPGRVVDVSVAGGMLTHGDPRLLVIVLENLIGNAWKFSARKDDARIVVAEVEPGVFVVKDNGAGFDPARKAKLFEPFQRLHTSAEFEGTGIGLATVNRILNRHGGRIWAESTPGHGASFFFTVDPTASVSMSPSSVAAPITPAGGVPRAGR